MSDEILTISDVASYLKMNDRTVYRLAQEGKIPAAKIAGQWRLRKDVLDEWLAGQMRRFATPAGPPALASDEGSDVELADVLRPESVSLELASTSKDGVLRELVDLAGHAGRVRMPEVLLRLLREREELLSTAVGQGVALPHARNSLSGVVDAPTMSFGRSPAGIPFGAPDGQPTSLFFMVCSPNDQIHLRLLSRLTRCLSRTDFCQAILRADTPDQVVDAFSMSSELVH